MLSQGFIRVVVADDDFMIAGLHQKFIEAEPGFTVVGIGYNAHQTLDLIEHERPDLLVLDVYLPDKSGLEVLSQIRLKKYACDVILITAAKELKIVEEAFRFGIFEYLMKPFALERLGVSLRKYALFRSHLSAATTAVNQGLVDQLNSIRSSVTPSKPLNESGIDTRTLERIRGALQSVSHPCTAEDIASLAGVSRSTARTYLEYMIEKGIAEEQLLYGNVGRPRRLFRILPAPTIR